MRQIATLTIILSIVLTGASPARGDVLFGSYDGGNSWNSSPSGEDPLFDFTYSDAAGNAGYGTLSTVASGLNDGSFWATSGTFVLTSSSDNNASVGTYSLLTTTSGLGPSPTITPSGLFAVDNLIFPDYNAASGVNNNSGAFGFGPISGPSGLTLYGLIFGQPGTGSQTEINIWGIGSGNYAFWSEAGGNYNIELNSGGTFTVTATPAPTSLVLALVGATCAGGFALRRRRSILRQSALVRG